MLRMPRHLTVGGLPVTDTLLATALCVLAAGGLLSGQVDERPLVVTLPVAALSTLAVALRTRFPVAVAGLIAGLAVCQSLLTGSTSATLWALLVFLMSAYTVSSECDLGFAVLGLALVLGGQFLCEWLEHGTDYPFDALVFGGAWAFGRGTRSWRNQAKYAEQHQRDLARLAVADERTRIARDLHDVVAHSLSVIAVQADAAEAALAKQPELAGAPMRAIRDSAREALADMREMLHVLRAEDGGDAPGPARGIDDLEDLIARMRESGMPLHAEVSVDRRLPSGLDVAVFRIVQEGLTNVHKHAGNAPATLSVARHGTELRIEVHNDRPGHSPDFGSSLSTGHGLIGVRERVLAAGGRFEAGPTETGGFSLVACLPLRRGTR